MRSATLTPRRIRPPARARPAARRRLTGRPRRLLRAVHVVAAGGWLGLVVAMLVLGITAATAQPGGLAHATYRSMDLIGGTVIPPLAVGTLVTGLSLSLLTPWGLVRHWWVATKAVLGLAVIVTAVSLTDSWLQQALETTSRADPPAVHLIATSVAHLAMLTFATVISVDKPWGRTPYGRRRATEKRATA